jgi:hypothetical protein
MFYSRKKEGGKIGYFRFLSVQKASIPMMQATATTTIIAISVVASGASATAVDSYSVAADIAGSGSIACAADGASST